MRRPIANRSVWRQGRRVAGGVALVGAGLWLGALASAYTTDSLKPLPPSAPAQLVEEAGPDDSASARAWARHAYGVGLRECPRVTEAYFAACSAQMEEEAKLAAAAAQWRQASAAAEAEVPAWVPEPEPDSYVPVRFEPGPEAAAPAPEMRVPAASEPDGDGEWHGPAAENMDGVVAPPDSVSSPPVG
jgi:hypothetical protein